MTGAREHALDRWDAFVQHWLDGAEEFHAPFDRWWSSYGGRGVGAPTREALPELYVGDWHKPRLVTLAINPGAADFTFQGRTGYFARQVRDMGYRAWAGADPYGGELWEARNMVNRVRANGRRVNPHREDRLRFAARWLNDPGVDGRELLMLELYPWHSPKVTGLIRPPPAVLEEFIWAPLAELDIQTVFAFGAGWVRAAFALGLTAGDRWPPGTFHKEMRQGVVFPLINGRQRLVVLWQSGYAGPPGAPDAERLRELLGE